MTANHSHHTAAAADSPAAWRDALACTFAGGAEPRAQRHTEHLATAAVGVVDVPVIQRIPATAVLPSDDTCIQQRGEAGQLLQPWRTGVDAREH